MADRLEFWKERLESFIPSCIYQGDEQTTQAVLYGMAAVLNALDCSLNEHLEQTFICQAEANFLNEHASERSLTRLEREVDSSLQQRTKNLVNNTDCVNIKELVDNLLQVGEAQIIEDGEAEVFYTRGNFYSRGDLLINAQENTFSIIVDKQLHEPYSFYTRDHFMNREDFIGSNMSDIRLFELIVEAVNRSKACGTAYRIIENQ